MSVDLQAAYLCVKHSVAEDLVSQKELLLAIQYAGFSPTQSFINEKFNESPSKLVSFEQFCSIAEELSPFGEDEMLGIFSETFHLTNGIGSTEEFKNALKDICTNNGLADVALSEFMNTTNAAQGKKINYKVLCSEIQEVTNELKKLSVENLKQKEELVNINSKTYTKKKPEVSGSGGTVINSECNVVALKGSFYLDRQCVIVHQFYLELPKTAKTRINITSFTDTSIFPSGVDILVYIFKETTNGMRNYVGFADRRDYDGKCYWEDVLEEGRYFLIPYTTGCILKFRETIYEHSLELITKTDNKILLTEEFIDILKSIYNQIDLDDNGYLNRQEFNLYNWRTSGEEVQDDEWIVVENNFDVVNGELSLKGFIALHQLEAEDNGGDTEDLWVSLESVGFNRVGQQIHAAPFNLEVISEACTPFLVVSGLRSGGLLLDKAVIRSVVENCKPVFMEGNTEVLVYHVIGPFRSTVVVQNKQNSPITLEVDCSESLNCITNRPNLNWIVEIADKSAIVAHQLLPKDSTREWNPVCYVNPV